MRSHLYSLSLVVSPMAANLVKHSLLLFLAAVYYVSLLLHDWRGVWTTFTHESFPVLNRDHLKAKNSNKQISVQTIVCTCKVDFLHGLNVFISGLQETLRLA